MGGKKKGGGSQTPGLPPMTLEEGCFGFQNGSSSSLNAWEVGEKGKRFRGNGYDDDLDRNLGLFKGEGGGERQHPEERFRKSAQVLRFDMKRQTDQPGRTIWRHQDQKGKVGHENEGELVGRSRNETAAGTDLVCRMMGRGQGSIGEWKKADAKKGPARI